MVFLSVGKIQGYTQNMHVISFMIHCLVMMCRIIFFNLIAAGVSSFRKVKFTSDFDRILVIFITFYKVI